MHEEWDEMIDSGMTPRGELPAFAARDSNIQEVLSRLQGVSGRGDQYMALCPAHNDHRPSLSIRAARAGKVLLHCFAGCRTEDVLRELGLPMRALFPEGSRGLMNEGGRYGQ